MHERMHVHIRSPAHLHTRLHACARHACACARVSARMRARMRTCMHACGHPCLHACVRACVRLCLCLCLCLRPQLCPCLCLFLHVFACASVCKDPGPWEPWELEPYVGLFRQQCLKKLPLRIQGFMRRNTFWVPTSHGHVLTAKRFRHFRLLAQPAPRHFLRNV